LIISTERLNVLKGINHLSNKYNDMMLISEIEHFIQEDLGYNDISCTLVPDVVRSAVIFVKQDCVLAGMEPAHCILEYFDLTIQTDRSDGDELNAGDTIFKVSGSAISILRAERLVLNFLAHLSGIATLTNQYVQQVTPFSNARVASTRKTTPGFRKFEKLAVIAGGGDPHRFNLSDSIMVKDNHIKMMGLREAIRSAKSRASFTNRIDVEVESADDAVVAAEMGADIIMLDNMDPAQVIDTVGLLKHKGLQSRVIIEVSGGIGPGNIQEYAKTGVDVISVGSLIHHSDWIDVSLEMSDEG